MPIYEYQCNACGHDWELMQKVSDPPPGHCPDCATDAVQRRVSLTSFQLKGTGWYVTDFKGGGSPGAGSEAPASKVSSPDAGSDSKGKDKATESPAKKDVASTSDTGKAPASTAAASAS
jgi:putative FmdB family regulatory protein